jgi:uncharacterized protein GlcG (DUF336 family)
VNSIAKRSIDAEAARKAIEAAAKKATELKTPMCIAVTDEAGNLKAFLRMDGAGLATAQIAQDKAYTAVSLGLPTHMWHDFIKDDPPLLAGFPHLPRLIIFGGGFPIREDGQIIGGIGLSGGHYKQDMECARAALAALGSPES